MTPITLTGPRPDDDEPLPEFYDDPDDTDEYDQIVIEDDEDPNAGCD